MTIGDDLNQCFALYDWMSNQILASSMVCRSPVTGCEFKSETEFAICGINAMKFWSVTGYNSICLNGIMEEPEPLTTVIFAFTTKTCVTGTSFGNLVIWNDMTVENVIAGHEGKIFALMSKSNALMSAGEDGIIIIWDNSFNQVSTINLGEKLETKCAIRAMDLSNSGTYLIGTANAEVIRMEQEDYKVLVQGHSTGELWGLCTSPIEEIFITCGGDFLVRLWEPTELKVEREFENEAKACDWAGNGEFVVLGFVGGNIVTINPNNDLEIISEFQSIFEGDMWIPDIKIAPNNQVIAFGGAPNPSRVELVKVGEDGSGLTKMKVIDIGLSGSLTHLDWDMDSANLITNSENFELVYVNVATCSVIKAAVCANNEWYTWTSVFGYSVKGLALRFKDIIDVNTVCRSFDQKVLAVGDDYGKVKLYKYPYIDTNATCKSYIGHSSKIAKVAFIGGFQ